jgi:hypothetical protein
VKRGKVDPSPLHLAPNLNDLRRTDRIKDLPSVRNQTEGAAWGWKLAELVVDGYAKV